MSFSTVLFPNYDDRSPVGFSLQVNKTMKGVENKNKNNNNIVVVKILMQGKPVQGETKKKLCMCSPTNHPGSFRCRYHRSNSIPNSVHNVAKEAMKHKSMPMSRFSKAHVVTSEFPR